MSVLQGKWGVVTGASSGLGVDFARNLAGRGCNLVLVARREDRLMAVASAVGQQFGVQVETIVLDLAQPDAPQTLFDRVAAKPVSVLINNAGYGLYGEFLALDWERELNMLDLNIRTVVHLTKLFLRDMVAQGDGYILQVASIGAYQPSPLYATYSAAKSFVLSFSEAVNYELRQHPNVSITTVSPGITRTEFLQVSGQQPTLYQRMLVMESEKVAAIAIDAMLKRKSSLLPGFMNRASVMLNRLLPRRMALAIAYATMKSN